MREGRRETREFSMQATAWFSIWGYLIPESNNEKVLSRALIAAIAEDRR